MSYINDKTRFQKYLPVLRDCFDVSLEDMAKASGLSRQFISLIEQGQRPMSKQHYVIFRVYFEELLQKNPYNLNGRDAFDLIFSEETFFTENKDQIDEALKIIVRDSKDKKNFFKTSNAAADTSGKKGSADTATSAAEIATGVVASTVAGAAGFTTLTATTGLAFPIIGIPLAAIAGIAAFSTAYTKKRQTEIVETKTERADHEASRTTESIVKIGGYAALFFRDYFSPIIEPYDLAADPKAANRASNGCCLKPWISEALNAKEE